MSAAPPRLITQEAARLSTPILPSPEEPRSPPVRVDLPAGLAGGAVVRLPVFIVDDRNRCPAPRARLLAVPVDPQEVKRLPQEVKRLPHGEGTVVLLPVRRDRPLQGR